MSYGGEISDRALWDKKWYDNQFMYPNENKYTLTFYDNHENRKDLTGKRYGLMLTPRHDPNATTWCTGDNRHKMFFTKRERYEFYSRMLEVLEKMSYDFNTQFLAKGAVGIRHLTDEDIDDKYVIPSMNEILDDTVDFIEQEEDRLKKQN